MSGDFVLNDDEGRLFKAVMDADDWIPVDESDEESARSLSEAKLVEMTRTSSGVMVAPAGTYVPEEGEIVVVDDEDELSVFDFLEGDD